MSYITMTPTHDAYPSRLDEVLQGKTMFAKGCVNLLQRTAIGICGSRDASTRALRWAYRFGAEAAKQEIVVVSGYARGVDREAHRGAMETGGSTIAVLPDGIRHFSPVHGLRDLIDYERNFLAISMFEPDAIWKAWRAMERNRLIVALSTVLFVIEARNQGGTINAALECVRQRKKLYAVAYRSVSESDTGNRRLIADSAIPLKHMGELKRALREAMSDPPPEVHQLVLNLVAETANGS
jgi:DNA processing protein